MQNIINLKSTKNLDDWFADKFNNFTLPFYSSIDLRNAHYKIAPVDAHLFPVGIFKHRISSVARPFAK
ncbi:hypothetical protein BIY23_02910 [Wolbachia pipientis]|uniref:Uncharacterized protein n=1 Tax=Wolbachia pipientis TaxID=955 RepID=A0A1E7QJI1_WOLPI|nr:hypothetical protein BIY23_02910 [Wolbachia pipientis]